MNFEFESDATGETIRGKINRLDSKADTPVVILLSGDGAAGVNSRSWSHVPRIFARLGIRTAMFDFQGLGLSDGRRVSLTLSLAVRDLEKGVDFITSRYAAPENCIGFFASSFGASALISAPRIANIATAIVLKAPASFLPDAYVNELTEGEFSQWISTGVCASNGYGIEVLRDALQTNIYMCAPKILAPCLIVHGASDCIIPVRHSEYLKLCLGCEAELKVYEGLGHTSGSDAAWRLVLKDCLYWLRARLYA